MTNENKVPQEIIHSDINNVANNVYIDYDTLQWTEIKESSGILLDIKYATTDNFTNEQVYQCGRCFLRKGTASKILSIHNLISNRYKLRIKLYDCYRPLSVQRELWNKYPNPNYVTNPEKGGMHNRGMAVDLTIIDSLGMEWDMGTPFDYFGREANMDFLQLPKAVISKRIAMKKIMEQGGLKGIRTEWWHYSDRDTLYDLSEWEWRCKK